MRPMPRPSRRRRRKGGRRKTSPPRWRRFLRRGLPMAVVILLATAAAGLFWVDRAVERRFQERTESFPSRVYAAPYTLWRGAPLDRHGLEEKLAALGYQAVDREPRRPGEFRHRGRRWDLYLRRAETPSGPRAARLVSIDSWWSGWCCPRRGNT